MPTTVWINGHFVAPDEARVAAFDAGLQHGVGLFETMLACGPEGRVFRIDRHLARLERSAAELGLTDALKVRALAELVEHVVARSELTGADLSKRARVRLTVTAGDLNMLTRAVKGGGGAVDPTVMIHAQPATEYPGEMFERGVTVVVADVKANPLNPFESHKTLNYWWRLRALQQAAGAGAGEAVVLQVTNHLCGGAVSNLFAVKDGVLHTPTARGEEADGAVPSPVLPGVTRGAVLDIAKERGIGFTTRLMGVADALDADEVFLTNSSWGVLPVTRIEKKTIGAGEVGPVTKSVREAWLELSREEP